MGPKKKSQKISLNEFLGDASLGSWADEMETLPNAPAPRIEDERPRDRFSRKDDFSSLRSDRVAIPPREDLPLPTQPPYTAFIGNLAFDLDELELGQFFGPNKNVKIIKDRDDKPKGFGYIEFMDSEGLKDALSKSGMSLAGRTIRVSVAEPRSSIARIYRRSYIHVEVSAKERSGFHDGGHGSDSRFDSPWRREGSLPESQDVHESRRRVDGLPHGDRPITSVSDSVEDWRSTRPLRVLDTENPQPKKKLSSFLSPDSNISTADKEDTWTIGRRFKPSSDEPSDLRYGFSKGRDQRPPSDSIPGEESDWRSSARPTASMKSTSPTNSSPSTPQMSRRKLELLPRSTSVSTSNSPLSSPRLSNSSISRSGVNPFGSARPVDVTSREKDIVGRLEKERELLKDRCLQPMSRSNSRTASERNQIGRPRTPPTRPHNDSSSLPPPSPKPPNAVLVSAAVRPSVSFANVAGIKKENTSSRDAT